MTERHSTFDGPILETNGVRLDLISREVVCDGVPVELSPVEFNILQILMRSAGQVVLKDQLQCALDHRRLNPFEGTLEMNVNQLKHKLERGRRLIAIIEGTGYLFVPADEHSAKNYQLA